MEKYIDKYAKIYRNGLIWKGFSNIEEKTNNYKNKLREMYMSEAYKKHDIYPSMDTAKVYAVTWNRRRLLRFLFKAKKEKIVSCLADLFNNFFKLKIS